MVIGLASVIIGISLLKKVTFIRVTTSVVIGSIVYKACVAIAIRLGMPSSDLKLNYGSVIPCDPCTWHGSQKEKEGGVNAGVTAHSQNV